jgi:hypothetical protein
MTIIVKEKAVFVNIGNHWLNLAHAQSISISENNKVVILWANGKLQGYGPQESQKIIECLEGYSK